VTHLVTDAVTQLFLQPQFTSHRTRLLNFLRPQGVPQREHLL